jgi:hypothetical protein
MVMKPPNALLMRERIDADFRGLGRGYQTQRRPSYYLTVSLSTDEEPASGYSRLNRSASSCPQFAQHGRPNISTRCPPSGGEGRLGRLVTIRAKSMPDGQITANLRGPCPAPARKIFRLTRRANQRY